MKKVICMLIAAFMFVASVRTISFAEDYGLISPSSGTSALYDDLTELTVNTPAGKNVSVLIDGISVAEYVSGGTDTVKLSEKIPVGSHHAEVIAYDSDTSQCYNSDFSVIKKTTAVNYECNFADGNLSGAGASQADVVGTDSSGNNVLIYPKSFTGIDGDENGSYGFIMDKSYEKKTLSDGTGEFILVSASTFGWKGGQINLDYDLKVFAKCEYEIETKTTAGDWGKFGGTLLTKNGCISTSSDEYPINEWMHFSHTIDLDKKVEYLTVNGKTYLNGTTIANCNNIMQFKFQYYVRNNTAGQGFAVDNALVTHSSFTGGFNSLYYMGTDGSYTKSADSYLSPDVTKIKLLNSTSGIAEGDLTPYITAKAENDTLKISSASISKSGELKIEFSRHLPPDADVSLNIKSPDGTVAYLREFRTTAETLGINSVTFQSGDKTLYLKKQLSGSSLCTASVNLKNYSDSAKSGVIVAVAYDGNQMTGFKALDVSAEGNASSQIVSVDFNFSETSSDPNVEIYLLDSFAERNALSKVWSLR